LTNRRAVRRFASPATGHAASKPALEDAKLGYARVFHDPRHTFGTTMAAARVPMHTLQE